MIKPGFVLGGLKALLHRPAGPGDGHQLGQGGAARRVTQEVGQLQLALLARRQGAAHQQLVIFAGGGDQRPVIAPRAFGAIAAAERLPGRAGTSAASASARLFPAAVVTCWLHGTAIT